jgi:hypothetical protein
MLDPDSATVRFRPDLAVVVNSPANLPFRPVWGDGLPAVAALVDKVCDHLLGLCKSLHDHAGCEIILDNFHLLPNRPFGNVAAKSPWETNSFLRRVNLELATRAPSFVHINDAALMADQSGLRRWFDSRIACRVT